MSTIEKALEKLKKEGSDRRSSVVEPPKAASEQGANTSPVKQEQVVSGDAAAEITLETTALGALLVGGPEVGKKVEETTIAVPGVPTPGAEPGIASGVEERASSSTVIDLDRLAAQGFLTPDSGRTQLAEEMRHIKRPLVLKASKNDDFSNQNANLIMVTSSNPSEGKTYTSLNLAMSVAKERDKTVLLVDADVAKPGVTKVLELEQKKGLVDFLADDSIQISDVMLETNVPNFRFLPAGKRHIHSTELISSNHMKELVNELCSRYPDRIVIFDSPPLLATSEASVLTELVGQIVMVVEAEKTTQQQLEEALSQISDASKVGFVLNKATSSFGNDYYGYGSYGS